MTALLELKGVHTYYGHIHAIKGIDISVDEGAVVTLVGANGAGKSTILRTVSGMVSARHGQVLLNGQDITARKPHEIAAMGIGHVPEGRRIFPRLSVRENLEVGGWNLKSRHEIEAGMEQAFTLFPRIKERVDQKGGTLSGGEQQMLAIARALMTNPRLLLLDEPSMGLAPVLVEQIFDIIARINSLGTTILLVEQNALMALEVAQRGYVLQSGSIVMSADSQTLLHDESVRKAYLGET